MSLDTRYQESIRNVFGTPLSLTTAANIPKLISNDKQAWLTLISLYLLFYFLPLQLYRLYWVKRQRSLSLTEVKFRSGEVLVSINPFVYWGLMVPAVFALFYMFKGLYNFYGRIPFFQSFF